MSPSNPSRKRVLPSWMKNAKSTKSTSATVSSNLSVLLDSNNATKGLSGSGENPTTVEEVDRVSHKSMFVPRNTVLFVMSELELLETARLILEEEDCSPPLQPTENNEAQKVDADEDVAEEEQQEIEEHLTDINVLPDVPDNTRNGFKNLDKSNNAIHTSWSSLPFKPKQTSKRKVDESPEDEDAMDVEPSPVVVAADPAPEQYTSGLFSVLDNFNKEFKRRLSNPKIDTVPNNNTTPSSSSSSSNTLPTQKKRLKPDLSVLDEIFF